MMKKNIIFFVVIVPLFFSSCSSNQKLDAEQLLGIWNLVSIVNDIGEQGEFRMEFRPSGECIYQNDKITLRGKWMIDSQKKIILIRLNDFWSDWEYEFYGNRLKMKQMKPKGWGAVSYEGVKEKIRKGSYWDRLDENKNAMFDQIWKLEKSDSSFVDYWCSTDILNNTEQNLERLNAGLVADFLATFHEGCNNAGYSELANDLLFKVLEKYPDFFLTNFWGNLPFSREFILDELTRPVNNDVNLVRLLNGLNSYNVPEFETWKRKIIQSLRTSIAGNTGSGQFREDPIVFDVPYLWTAHLCTLPAFSSFFYCDSSGRDYFEVELFKDPVKGPFFISLNINQGEIEEIFLTRMYFSRDSLNPVSGNFEKHFMFNMPFSNAQMCCSYDLPIKITDRTNIEQLNAFFSEIIWELPFENEDDHLLDPEIWTVLGRINGKKYRWSRWSFSDSTYYANLQILLDLCGVKDFKYEVH